MGLDTFLLQQKSIMIKRFTGYLFYKIGILVLVFSIFLTITIFSIIDYYYTDQDTILDAHELFFYSQLIDSWNYPQDTTQIKLEIDNLHFSLSIYDNIGGDLVWFYPDTVNPRGYIGYSNSDTLGFIHDIDIPLYVSFGSTDVDANITWIEKSGLHYFLKIDQAYSPEYINYIPPVILSFLFMIILNLFIRKFLNPIQLMKKRIKSLKEGDLDSEINIISNDELADLSMSINKMISDIKSLLAQKQQLLLDVSHELRSPLARMRLITEMLPNHKNKNKMIDEIIYLEGMISNLLLSDKLSAPYSNLNIKKIGVNSFIELVLELSNIKLSDINIKNECAGENLYIDKTKMVVAVRNLIDNANKYGGNDPVGLEVTKNNKAIMIMVDNTFDKIDERELDKIFLPFYRMKSTENKATGFGLGLTICKKIIESHGGTIDFKIKNNKIIFTIILPENNDFKK